MMGFWHNLSLFLFTCQSLWKQNTEKEDRSERVKRTTRKNWQASGQPWHQKVEKAFWLWVLASCVDCFIYKSINYSPNTFHMSYIAIPGKTIYRLVLKFVIWKSFHTDFYFCIFF
jgi:hypothetical protein